MKNTLFLLPILFCGLLISCTKQTNFAPYEYTAADSPWNEGLGNHRIVFNIDAPTDAARLSVDWRRPDADVEKRRFLVVHAETGDTVQNIHRLTVNNEHCEFLCGPLTEKGNYYFYYLPYQVQPNMGGYGKDYEPKEAEAEQLWLQKVQSATDKQKSAQIIRFESRTEFDSFYPMEVAATMKECETYQKEHPATYWVFPEDRKYPIRMKDQLPYKWIRTKDHSSFKGEALQNEYYAFQLGIWAGNAAIENVTYSTDGLKSGKDVIRPEAITCFNIQGINPAGKSFTKKVDVAKGAIQPMWFGIDVAKDQPSGTYQGQIIIQDGKGNQTPVQISLKVRNEVLADRGDSELWRHSRLRWLNSTLGINDHPTAGYEKINADQNSFSCLGRTIDLNKQTALPMNIQSWQQDILAAPVRFIVQTSQGVKNLQGNVQLETKTEGSASYSWKAEDEELSLTATVRMEFDGWMNYVYSVNPKKNLVIKDIRLELPLKKEASSYFMGVGLPGQFTPQYYKGKWDTQEEQVNNFGVSIPVSKRTEWLWPFDSFWCGTEKAGIHCELRGTSYSGPLLNLYRPAYPASWYNNGKGGFEINRKANQTLLTVYSGSRNLEINKPLSFDFALLVTPVKPINYKSQFTDRYYHNQSKPIPEAINLKDGVRVINVHHANFLNPFINYPFRTVDKMKAFIKESHQKNCKVKYYYTIRELSNVTTEIWALRSLGEEILRGGKGGGYTWCREHFVTDYTPQWYHHLGDMDAGVTADAAILTATGDSRWYNYYIEGLAWMVKNTDLDGIYLDDVAFDRNILKRMRHAMEDIKKGCVIDLHSNTGFSRCPGIQYAEFFPYVDKLWFGESFMYDEMPPENWLVEVSGIPFGLMGDMLHRGGNKWLGMQYGMTSRQPWLTEGVKCDPRYIWRFWDEFGIADSKMNGFWEENPIVTSTDKDVKVTAYVKDGKTLLSVGNYATTKKQIKLNIDWKRLGLDPATVKMQAPAIQDFQEGKVFKTTDSIPVEPKKGWLIVVE